MPQGQPLTVPDDGLTTRARRNAPILAVHTGPGKGKSTAAFGMALRAWNQGFDVAVFQFVKSAKWKVGEEAVFRELGRLLRSLSSHLREDARTRSELESRQSWTINGARLAVSAPWLVLLLLCFQPEVIQRYSSPTGLAILVFGAVVCVVAYRLMLRIGRLPTEGRILS